MSASENTKCPLCPLTAQLAYYGFNPNAHYLCQKCRDLVVTPEAMSWLKDALETTRNGVAATAAKTPDGHALYIYCSSGSGTPSKVFSPEVLPLEEALRR
jgi:hypothetical protein